MKRDVWLPWLVFGVTVVGLLVAGTLLVQRIAHLRRAPTSQAPAWSPARTQVTDYASGGMLTIAFRSGNDFPGGSFEDRGQRLVARHFDPPTARLKALGFVKPTVILGGGSLSIKGRKAYYQALLHELPRPGGTEHMISTVVLVDCPERGATGAVSLSLRVPRGRPVGAGADLRGTPADPQFLTDELELSSAELCAYR
jgi:hypothetical protein